MRTTDIDNSSTFIGGLQLLDSDIFHNTGKTCRCTP